MSDESIKVLLIEDNPGDARLIREFLSEIRINPYALEWKDNLSEGLEFLTAKGVDLILLDLSLPDSQGFDTFARVYAQVPNQPIVVVTGSDDKMLAARAVHAGAQDYLVKGEIDSGLLAHAIRYAIERKKTETVLRESREFLEKIVNSISDPMYVVNREHRYVLANDAMCAFASRNREDVLGRTDYDFFPKEQADILSKMDEQVFETGQENENEEVIMDGGGTVRTVITKKSLYTDKARNKFIVGVIRDISERKRAEDALKQAEEKYRDIFENSVTGIYQITMEGRFLRVNMAIADILGYDSPEELSNEISDFKRFYVYPERRSELLHLIKEHGSVREFEVEFFRKDKTVVWASLNVRAVRNSTGEIAYMEGTAIDITDSKLLRARLDQAQKMEAIGTLAGGIAHDFNNILAPIIGYTELSLNSVPKDNRLSHNMSQVLLSAVRAKDLVNQILTFSRKTQQERKPVQVSLILKETINLIRSSLPTTINIRQSLHQDALNSMTMADPTQIHQVLMNLCTNAGHAMRDSGGTLTVTLKNVEIGPDSPRVSLEMETGPYIRLSVADTGHGMDEAVKQRIFDPYFTTKGPDEGTGLGLALVYGIVKDLSGAVTVSSRLGKGTTFDVYFPRTGTTPSPTAVSKRLPTGHGRILVVDDEKFIVDMVKEMLENLGYEVVPRYSSPGALETFKSMSHSFDLVITDMTMPNMTGIDLAREIFAIRPCTPLILFTGFSQTVDENQLKSLGVKELLMKPVSMSDLAVAVDKVLNKAP
jgi:PAS domain S-box-containing protein